MSVQKIFTDAHLYNPDILLHATAFIRRIDDLKRIKNVQLDAELVLEITPDDQGMLQCGYYFVDHQTRSLFWLEEFEAEDLTYEIKGLSSAAHLSTRITFSFAFLSNLL
jgi:hypothetical protein